MTSYPSPLPVDAETRHVDMRGSQPNEQQYIENRVLTPSVYRSLKKEFGVQTGELNQLFACTIYIALFMNFFSDLICLTETNAVEFLLCENVRIIKCW